MVERAFGMMKARWRATLFKVLELSPAFASDIITCCAFLHNLCLKTNDIMELEDWKKFRKVQTESEPIKKWQVKAVFPQRSLNIAVNFNSVGRNNLHASCLVILTTSTLL